MEARREIMENQKLLTVAEAAQILRIAPATLYSWCRQRRVPCVRLGDRVLLDPSEIIRANRVPADGDADAGGAS